MTAVPLAPLIFFISNVIDIRLEAKRLLTRYQRPVYQTVEGIGNHKSDVEKDRPNHLIFAEHSIIEELKQRGAAGGGLPKHKNSHLAALT